MSTPRQRTVYTPFSSLSLSLSCLSSSQQGLITWFSAMGGLGLGGSGLHRLGWLAGSGRRMCLDSLVWWCCGVVMKGGGRSVVDGGEWVRGDRVLDLSRQYHFPCIIVLSCCRAVFHGWLLCLAGAGCGPHPGLGRRHLISGVRCEVSGARWWVAAGGRCPCEIERVRKHWAAAAGNYGLSEGCIALHAPMTHSLLPRNHHWKHLGWIHGWLLPRRCPAWPAWPAFLALPCNRAQPGLPDHRCERRQNALPNLPAC